MTLNSNQNEQNRPVSGISSAQTTPAATETVLHAPESRLVSERRIAWIFFPIAIAAVLLVVLPSHKPAQKAGDTVVSGVVSGSAPVSGAPTATPSIFDAGSGGQNIISIAANSDSLDDGANNANNDGNGMQAALPQNDAVIASVRPVEPFSRLDADVPANVLVKRAAVSSVEIRTTPAVQKHLTAETRDGVLVLSAQGNFSVDSPIEIIVSTPTPLRGVEANGTGSINAGELSGDATLNVSGVVSVIGHGDMDRVKAEVSGTSSLTLSGSAKTVNLETSGMAHVSFEDLSASVATLDASGVGEVSLAARDSFRGDVSGVSHVRVLGQPKHRSVSQSGLGDVSFE